MSKENTTVLSSFYVSLGQKHFPIVFYLNTFPKKIFPIVFSLNTLPKALQGWSIPLSKSPKLQDVDGLETKTIFSL